MSSTRKRQAIGDKPYDGTTGKRGRGGRGLLKHLVGMPLDVIFEVSNIGLLRALS